jgi:hypothetical protein
MVKMEPIISLKCLFGSKNLKNTSNKNKIVAKVIKGMNIYFYEIQTFMDHKIHNMIEGEPHSIKHQSSQPCLMNGRT